MSKKPQMPSEDAFRVAADRCEEVGLPICEWLRWMADNGCSVWIVPKITIENSIVLDSMTGAQESWRTFPHLSEEESRRVSATEQKRVRLCQLLNVDYPTLVEAINQLPEPARNNRNRMDYLLDLAASGDIVIREGKFVFIYAKPLNTKSGEGV